MFGIGEFARLGLVSVRMLRHYDAVGLLRPAHVDPATGRRSYTAAQLARLNRVIALKDLGFTLQQVRSILDEEVGAAELHGMVRLLRAQLEARIAEDAVRLRGIEARLRAIEREGRMDTEDVVVKGIAPVLVAELRGTAPDLEYGHIGPVVQELFGRLGELLGAAGARPASDCGGIACYEPREDGSVLIRAGVPLAGDPGAGHPFEVVALPRIERAATLVHQGPMDDVGQAHQALAHWIERHGHRASGQAREVTLQAGAAPADWVTELQWEIAGPAEPASTA
ncbi:MerR family transcriptional regulator [Allonocardiopsis opalescens]|uniref:DNA-binding transcriptional MerR regulator n=1 Tax=Allonocardiopsis opalescens TaxID=1144618 RepID=A0A2T0Q9I2_9ACTN|nr:MerR family transcriptional regulator [Allonocardiopsis opalescens]PRY00497.1 DNA-binding transcriptional MerR regulator [Allonocardiopsis opalescens]